MQKRIVISVITNLCFDQRVGKTANTLAKNGKEILLIGTQLRGNPELKRDYCSYRMPIWFQRSFLLYAEFNIRLFFQLLFKTRKNDILWANDLDSLIPNYLISRLKKLPLVYDSHELFPEMPSVQGRFSQKVWRFLERKLISKPDKVITVSDSIADWMKENYKIERPIVIKNLPLAKGDISYEESENFILYQGALNKGRGLMELIESMQFIPENIQLKIAGEGPMQQTLKNFIHENKLEHRVHMLGQKPPEELQDITRKALLGISLEQDLGLSYRFSLPNKLFDYIQARTPVVATYLPEIKNLTENYQIGEVIKSHQPKDIADAIMKVINNGKSHYKDNLNRAAEELIWEKGEPEILGLINAL